MEYCSEKTEQIKARIKDLLILINDLNISLTPSQRRGLSSLGNNRTAFVEKTIELINAKQEELPHHICTKKLENLYEITNTYNSLLEQSNLISKTLLDCLIHWGNETFKEAKYLKKRIEVASMVNPGLQEDVKLLNIFFRKPKTLGKKS